MACNATDGIALAILSVHPSVRRVYCDGYFDTTGMAITLNFLTPTVVGGERPLLHSK